MLEIMNINTFYGKMQSLWGVSMSIKDAEIVALIGANGSGKTTLLNTISGIIKPVSGIISFQGKQINNLHPHHIVEMGISHIPEGGRPFLDMSVRKTWKWVLIPTGLEI
jgi:branched-chain amino acid transport system ATP-binding protein